MAARYLVASGTWDASNTAIWSASSGGAPGASVPTGSDGVVMDAASGAVTVTLGANVPFGTLTLTGFTGTIVGAGYVLTSALNANTLFTGATTCTITGLALNLTYSGATGTRTINPGATTEANSVSIRVSAGTDNISITASTRIRDIDFTGFSGTVGNTARSVYGNWNSGAATFTAGGDATTFAATSGTQVVTSNGVTMDFPITVNAPGATVQLADALTMGSSRAFTHTAGGLNLNGKNLTAGFFVSSNSNVRSITSGGGQFYLTAAASSGTVIVFGLTTITNLTLVDRPTVNLSGAGSGTYTRRVEVGAVGETKAPNINVTAGTDSVALPLTGTTTGNYGSVNFIGFSGAISATVRTVYGNWTLSPAMSTAAGGNATTFAATSGTQVITSNGVTMDFPVTVNCPGATVQLADALTLGSSRALTLTDGSFNANGFNVTAGSVSGSSAFDILNMGSGTWSILGAGAGAWSISAGLTSLVCGTSTVSMLSASAKTFASGGKTYWNLSQDGLGTLTVGNSNPTFNSIINTVQPTTIILPASTTTTVTNFSLGGTSGNLVTLQSSSAGTRATLSKASGTVNVSYLSIKDSAATGGATWNAGINDGNANAGNNTGWSFSVVRVPAAVARVFSGAPTPELGAMVTFAQAEGMAIPLLFRNVFPPPGSRGATPASSRSTTISNSARVAVPRA